MRILISIILMTVVFETSAQIKSEAQKITNRHYVGYVFPKENVLDTEWMPFHDLKERYTPSFDDILKAEEILKQQLKEINESLINQGNNCPIIHKKLRMYTRQYYGYINNNGEKIIWMNLFWVKNQDDLDYKRLRIVLDGCSYYWNIKVNLNKAILFDLIVNGSA